MDDCRHRGVQSSSVGSSPNRNTPLTTERGVSYGALLVSVYGQPVHAFTSMYVGISNPPAALSALDRWHPASGFTPASVGGEVVIVVTHHDHASSLAGTMW